MDLQNNILKGLKKDPRTNWIKESKLKLYAEQIALRRAAKREQQKRQEKMKSRFK